MYRGKQSSFDHSGMVSAPASRRRRLPVVIARGGGYRLALRAGRRSLLAKLRILTARQSQPQPRDRALPAAEPLLHRFGFFAAEQLAPLQAAEGVQIVAVDEVLGILLLAIIEVL